MRLDLTGAVCDLLAFDAALARAAAATVSADSETPSDANEPLREAVRLYRGSLLPDCRDEWAQDERRAREQAYLAARERLARIAQAKGEISAAVGYLRQLLAADPFRESAWGDLMWTLAGGGDAAAVMQVYRDLRLLLRRELSTEPAPETAALYRSLMARAARPALTVPASPTPTPVGHPRHLPVPLSDLFGRQKEIEEVAGWLGQCRLATLVGTGGIGKTRLSIAVAERVIGQFPGGVWFIDLAPLSDPALLAQTVLRQLGVSENPPQTPDETLEQAMAPQTLLLILDNCEHLLLACATLASRLLSACPDLRILATSREALVVPGERLDPVAALALPPTEEALAESVASSLLEYSAVRLFAERAGQYRSSFALTLANVGAVVRVCHGLDGIPLAIELAAARLRSMTVEELETRLSDRFRMLTGGSRTALPRQQTLRALIDWSYDLLDEGQKALLRRLSVFVGGWTLEAAEAVCGGDGLEAWEVLDVLTALADKSLLIADATESGATRFRFLKTIRQYAHDRLAENGELALWRERHLTYFLALGQEAQPKLNGADQALWLDRLTAELDNLRQAFALCAENTDDGQKGLRLMTPLVNFWFRRGHLNEARQRYTTFLAMEANTAPTRERAAGLLCAGILAHCQGDNPKARTQCEEALAIHQQIGDRHGMAGALGNLNWQSIALTCLGSVTFDQQDYAAARAYSEGALEVCRQLGNRETESIILNSLGRIARNQSAPADAIGFYEQALVIDRELGMSSQEAVTLFNLAVAYSTSGDLVSAGPFYCQAMSQMHEGSDLHSLTGMLETVASVWVETSPESLEPTCQLLGTSERIREETGGSLSPSEQEVREGVVARVRESLPAETAAAWAQGRAMTIPEAIAFAIRETQSAQPSFAMMA